MYFSSKNSTTGFAKWSNAQLPSSNDNDDPEHNNTMVAIGIGGGARSGRLRELAAWYRAFAERTENPAIWEGRLQMAEDLEERAERASSTAR